MTLTPRERALSLAAVISASFGIGLAFGIGFPLTALTLELWREPNWIIGLAGASPAIAVLFALPALPRIVSRVGPVTAIAAGCALGGSGFLALSIITSAWPWIIVRLLMSAGLALPWLAGEMWINTVTHDSARGRVIALYAIAFFTGFALGPFLLDRLGLTELSSFVAGALGTAIAGVPIILARRLAPDFSQEGAQNWTASLRLAPVGMAAGFISGFAEISNLSLIPNVALAAGTSQDIALALLTVMTVGGVVMQYPIGWLADKVARINVLLALAAGFVALSLLLPWALHYESSAIVAAFLLGGVILGFYTLGLAIVGEQVSAKDLASANVAFLIMYQLGAIFGPFASGAAMSMMSPVGGFVLTMAGLMSVASAFLYVLSRKS